MVGEGMSEGGMGGGGGAMSQEAESGRLRAWVLVSAQDPANAAGALMDAARTEDYVLVRADGVSYGNVNLIVPVVQLKTGGLNKALTDIRKVPGVTNATAARVNWHRPDPDSGNNEHIEGSNAWG